MQYLNVEVKSIVFKTSPDLANSVFAIIDTTQGQIPVDVSKEGKIQQFLNTFSEGYENQKYIRLLLADNEPKVIGVAHIVKDEKFMLELEEAVVEPETEEAPLV